MTSLSWLPTIPDSRARLRAIFENPGSAWAAGLAVAATRLDFVGTNGLDRAVFQALNGAIPYSITGAPVRLAILGSSTFAHLHSAIRVAGLRRNMHIAVYENEFGQYLQELSDDKSPLYAFNPTVVVFAFDAMDLSAGLSEDMSCAEADAVEQAVEQRIRGCWNLARDAFSCPIIHQTALQMLPLILGSNEHRLPGSRHGFIERHNNALRQMADIEGVDILALDNRVAHDGIAAWHDASLWHRAKQEISPAAAPFYGELVVRIVGAQRGNSRKCLVMDLDNTLWGGVVGDDGLKGLILGQGSALGEAFVAFQNYAKGLSRRGIILAICSKNDEANALEPFGKHPEMILERSDIACFVANWNDKADNIRVIADRLSIGIDSIVFVDDNPFERHLIRQELPMVAVPEVGDDPAHYARCLADAGYFEAVRITADDHSRNRHYQGNVQRGALRATMTDLPAYLHSLEMQLIWRRFDRISLQRIVQLINKTNQFNLTTRRYTEDEVHAIMENPRALGLQLRLIDRFGDNGIISIVTGEIDESNDLIINTWLMSCRVLGRQLESATLNLVAAEARRLGAARLVGLFRPTPKNSMVKDHYRRLGFKRDFVNFEGESRDILDLADFVPCQTFIDCREE